MTVPRLIADLVLRTTRFEEGANNARKSGKALKNDLTKSLGGVSGAFNTAIKDVATFNGALASIASVGGIALLAKNAIDAADRFDELSERLGVSAEELQKFQYAAKLGGVEAEQLETAITKLNSGIAEGNLPYKNTSDALLDIADRVKNASNNIERASIVNDAFGNKLGAKLIPFLIKGSDGIRLMGQEAEKLGLVFSDQTTKAAAEFNDQLDVLGMSISKNFQQGMLSGFVDSSGQIRDIYTDPDFIAGLQEVGRLFGLIAKAGLQLAQVPAYLKAIFIELPSKAGEGLGNLASGRGLTANNPNVSFQRPQTVDQATFLNKPSGGMGQTAKDLEERSKKLREINDEIAREVTLTAIKADNYGLAESAINRAIKAKEIELKLANQGITLSQSERDSIQQKLDLLEQQEQKLSDLEKTQKEAQKADERRQQAITQLGYAFESAFEDAIINGGKLSDVLNALLQDIIRLIVRTQITAPLIEGLFGSSSGGGGGGGGIGGLLSSFLPSFDVGTDRVPRDMIAKIHKDEMIIPADEANAMRNGGGGNVSVKVNNFTNARVQTNAIESQNGTELSVTIDQIMADNIIRQGSRTNQALKSVSNRSLIKR